MIKTTELIKKLSDGSIYSRIIKKRSMPGSDTNINTVMTRIYDKFGNEIVYRVKDHDEEKLFMVRFYDVDGKLAGDFKRSEGVMNYEIYAYDDAGQVVEKTVYDENFKCSERIPMPDLVGCGQREQVIRQGDLMIENTEYREEQIEEPASPSNIDMYIGYLRRAFEGIRRLNKA